MTKLFAPLIFLLIVSCNPGSQTDQNNIAEAPTIVKAEPTVKQVEKSDPIASIRQKVESINTDKLEKKHFEFICVEKMMVDYFYRNEEIVKIAVDFGPVGDVYAKEGYYYDKGKLIFIYEFVEGGPACEGCIKTDEYRSYVQNNRVIKFLKNQAKDKCHRCEFSDSSRHYKLLLAKTPEQIKAVLCPGA